MYQKYIYTGQNLKPCHHVITRKGQNVKRGLRGATSEALNEAVFKCFLHICSLNVPLSKKRKISTFRWLNTLMEKAKKYRF